MNNEEEATPVGAAAIRQRSAFAAMVDQYQQPLGSYLLHLIGNQQVALAVTGETFVRAHRANIVNQPVMMAGAWLYGVATRLAYRHLRQLPSAPLPPPRLEWMVVGPGRAKNWEGGLVESVLSHLQPSERAVLLLCDLEQRPLDEVAQMLGTSTERVHRRLARARARFRLAYVAGHGVVSSCPDGSITS